MDDLINTWYKTIWETKGARFNAARRMELHADWASITLSLITVYVLILNITRFVSFKPGFLTSELITFLTISFSILILVISIYLNQKNYRLKEYKFHQNGKDISIIYDKIRELKFNPNSDNKQLDGIILEYRELISSFEMNHKSIDYLRFQIDHPEEYNLNVSNWKLYKFRIKSMFRYLPVSIYVLGIVAPIGVYLVMMGTV